MVASLGGNARLLRPRLHFQIFALSRHPSSSQTHDNQREQNQGRMEDAGRSPLPNSVESCMRVCVIMKGKNAFREKSPMQAWACFCSILLWISQGVTPTGYKNLMTARCSSVVQTSKSEAVLYIVHIWCRQYQHLLFELTLSVRMKCQGANFIKTPSCML